LIALLAGACRGASAHEEAAAVVKGIETDRVLLTGEVHATNALDIAVPVTNESTLTIRWLIADGAVVKAGDRVVEYDVTSFAERLRSGRKELATAEAQAKLARRANAVQLAEKKLSIREREIAHEKAKIAAGLPADLVTKRTAQENELSLTQTTADLHLAKHDLIATTKQLALSERIRELELDKLRRSIAGAEKAVADLSVRAPRDGLVVIAKHPSEGRAFHVGDSVEQGQVVLAEPDLEQPMEVHAKLVDIDDGRVPVGMTGTCTLDAYPHEPIACKVTSIWPLATGAPGSLRRTFTVTLSLAQARSPHLRPRMAVKVALP
jgi:HlyD family secretion protein